VSVKSFDPIFTGVEEILGDEDDVDIQIGIYLRRDICRGNKRVSVAKKMFSVSKS